MNKELIEVYIDRVKISDDRVSEIYNLGKYLWGNGNVEFI